MLGATCLVDMISTIWAVMTGRASEMNPIMCWYLSIGIWAFVVAKVFFWLAPVVVMEIAREGREWFGKLLLRITLVCYILVYCGSVWHFNC